MSRKEELKSEQKTLEIQLEKLKLQYKSFGEPNCSEEFEREARGLQKKITNIKMKLRSMQIKRLDRGLPTSSYSKPLNCDKTNNSDKCDKITEIDVIDDEFDPNEQNLTHERPTTRVFPDIPLPHASFQWEKSVYVAKWRHILDEQSLLSGNFGLPLLSLS